MKTWTIRTSRLASTIGRLGIALLVASAIGGLALRPAFADGDEKRDEHRAKDSHQRESHDDRDQREHRQPFYYSEPIYVPSPVYYAPPQSPGINLVFPLDIQIR